MSRIDSGGAPGIRMDLEAPLVALVDEIRWTLPELSHVDSRRVLFVAGAARLSAKASIRPLTFGGTPPSRVRGDGRFRKPRIQIDGVEMLYEICLRPRFFLESTAAERLGLIVHELWHASLEFDGALEPSRRHRVAGLGIEQEVTAAIGVLRLQRPNAGAFLAERGEHTLRSWLERPPSLIPKDRAARDFYTERELYSSIVELA
ncbi:MAG: hypothetical protein HYV07_13640 [Deltaproteobacteria bacterium]|nr:hypothetical protein [Deltaproteobacteria bacterium]